MFAICAGVLTPFSAGAANTPISGLSVALASAAENQAPIGYIAALPARNDASASAYFTPTESAGM